jgi:hypothetical protein|tara:strand:+ start:1046 stop:1195 length:150 start_codon:yes stop_codon:yes gene_type:complete
MMIEIDMMGEEDELMSADNPEAPEVFEPVDELDYLYGDEQLHMQSIFDL